MLDIDTRLLSSPLLKMSRNVVEMFAAAYPKNRSSGTNEFDTLGSNNTKSLPSHQPVNTNLSQMRTPVMDVVKESHSAPLQSFNLPQQEMFSSGSDNSSGVKKFLAVLLIVFGSVFIFSSFAYTMSHAFTSKFGLELFGNDGQPMTPIIAIHAIILFIFVYLVVNVLKWC